MLIKVPKGSKSNIYLEIIWDSWKYYKLHESSKCIVLLNHDNTLINSDDAEKVLAASNTGIKLRVKYVD